LAALLCFAVILMTSSILKNRFCTFGRPSSTTDQPLLSTKYELSTKTGQHTLYLAAPANDAPVLYLNVTADNEEVHLRSAIFFLETSGRPFYTPRDLCALDSAARHHPNKTIVMVTSSHYLINTAIQHAVTSKHKNIQFVRFNFTALALRTPLEDWLVDRPDHPLKLGPTGVEHSSDILRSLVLYIFGGTYMDTDVIVLKLLDQFRNSVGLSYHVPGSDLTNGAFFAMDMGHAFLAQFLNETRWK
jgi:hypothetical protein